MADNSVMKSNGVGNVVLNINNKGKTRATISNVMFCPESAANLMSVHQIAEKGNILVFDKKGVSVFPGYKVKITGESVLTGSAVNGIYKLDRDGVSTATVYDSVETALLSSNKCSRELWHKRMGHLNYQDLSKLKNLASGIIFTPSEIEVGVPCVKGKHSKKPFLNAATRATEL